MTISIGAIRWDAWYASNTSSVAFQEAASFYGNDLQSFAPSHWTANNTYKLDIYDATQSVIDVEIAAANTNGIGYWAYLMYGTVPAGPDYASGLMNAWNYHQTSAIKNRMPWVAMTQLGLMGVTGNYATQVATLVGYFQQSNYFSVLSGRPLLYIYWSASDLTTYWGGSTTNLAPMITALRAACSSASIGNPYIVVMNGLDTTMATGIGADAISSYNPSVVLTPSMSYANFSTGVQAYWTQQLTAAAGASLGVVPNASSGWTNKGRRRRPVGWEIASVHPRMGELNTVIRPSNTELKAHISAAQTFVTSNSTVCAANTILLYSWNEHTEGVGVAPSIIYPAGLAVI